MLLFIGVSIIALIIGAYTDIKTREVPDWLNFSLVASGIGMRIVYSLSMRDSTYIFEGLFGFGLAFIVANAMYYTGQWGGGDSKMLMGLGALIGFDMSFEGMFSGFLINILFIGAMYGLVWSSYLAIRNRKRFMQSFRKIVRQKKFFYARIASFLAVAACITLFLTTTDRVTQVLLLVIAILMLSMLYLWAFVRAVEGSCMLKYVSPKKLTEGDWIAKDVIIDKKRVTGPKDLGVTNEQIAKLQTFFRKGKIQKVLIKEGIPFVPSFLIAFLVTLFYGNLILAALQIH